LFYYDAKLFEAHFTVVGGKIHAIVGDMAAGGWLLAAGKRPWETDGMDLEFW
jgi:hypothetical protein